MASAASETLTLNVLVEKERNQVVFVEANKDFIDVLFSFLTMPIGTITRLTREQLSKVEIGCLNNLYSSIENLDEKYLQSTKFRGMLLHPRSAAEVYCRSLKLNVDETCTDEYFACRDSKCSFVSQYQITHCRCGKILDPVVQMSNLPSVPQDGGGYVIPTACFMISDDFQVTPMSAITGLSLLSKYKALDGNKIGGRNVKMGRDKVLRLLKCSLTSRTPFSDTIMERPMGRPNYQFHCRKYGPRSTIHSQKGKDSAKIGTKINLKLIVSKSKNKALYAEVEGNFVELLCGFLTIPLGCVFKEFPSLCFNGCMGNLYKSIQDIDCRNFFKSEEMKSALLNPKLASSLSYVNQLVGIKKVEDPSFLTLSSLFTTLLHELSSKSHQGEATTSKGFIKGLPMFMVSDKLVITPLSSVLIIRTINESKVPLGDIGELEVVMGEDEALRLLVASLVSESPLTDAFMKNEP